MKYAILLIPLFFSYAAEAGIYKCLVGGKISYQETPCKISSDGHQVKLPKDISEKQKLEAYQKLKGKLVAYNERKQREKDAYDKERRIRAEELRAANPPSVTVNNNIENRISPYW